MTPRSLLLFVTIFFNALLFNRAQGAEEKIEFPAASQHALVKQRVGLTDFEIDYSRPNRNKRDIFGGLVPFDKLWRTGANAPTRIKLSGAVKMDGKDLAAGEYALFTIPGEKQWTIIFSKDAKVQSAADYKQENDAVRVEVAPVRLAAPIESFTIGFDDLRADSATLFLAWETTRVPIKFTTDAVEKLSGQIEAAIQSGKEQDAGFYYSAASFYFEQEKELPRAAKLIEQAAEKNPKAYFVFYKMAQIKAKLGDKSGAISAAEKSNEILNAQPNRDENALRANRLLIESLR